MRPRSYAFLTIGAFAAVFGGTVAANVLIDPQGVFDSGLISAHVNANSRYRAFRAYSQSPAQYEGVVFGSSRAGIFDRDLLAERFGVSGVAKFAVPLGLMPDHLPALEYLIRDKARRGDRLKAVFLVIDADHFGRQPWTNLNIDSFQPPQISGETPLRFWWRYLTVFQFRNWRADLRHAWRSRPAAAASAQDETVVPAATIVPVKLRPDLTRQLSMLQRLVALCQQHGARLVVVMSPLSRANAEHYDSGELDRIVEQIGRVTPVWDFGRPAWLADRPEYWQDPSHFTAAAAAMIIDRIFGVGTSAPDDFGHLVGASLRR